MAKTTDASVEQQPAQAQPTTGNRPVYIFRKNGTQRTFEVDLEHLRVMATRNDLTYIGDTPLPQGYGNEKTVSI